MTSFCPAVTREQSQAPPRNSNGDWTSLGQHERLPEVPVVTWESRSTREKPGGSPVITRWDPFMLQHLKRIPTFPLELRNVTWQSWCNSKCSLTQWSHSRGTPRFQAQLNLSTFSPPYLNMRVYFPALSPKGSRPSSRTSEGGCSHIETQEEASWLIHIPKDTDIPVDPR